jgi:hypothetical protein
VGNSLEKLSWVVGLDQELVDIQGAQLVDMALQDGRAADHHRLEGRVPLDPAADLNTRKSGQVQIQQDHVEGPLAGKGSDRLQSIGDLNHLEPFSAKEFRDQGPKQVFVLDEQQFPQPNAVHGSLLV